MKTFTEVVTKSLNSFFQETKEYPFIVGFITHGFPLAIASYLANDMYEGNKTETELVIEGSMGKVMRFGLKALKKGDAVAFIPEFDVLDAGKEMINSDEIEFDSQAIESFARDLMKNETLMKCFREAFGGKIYVDGEFQDIDNASDADKGIVFEVESDAAIAACSIICSIIEILCNNKDASTDITYEVPGLGTFKVSPIKGGYSVSLTFDKEFKVACKSDKLSEKIAAIVE